MIINRPDLFSIFAILLIILIAGICLIRIVCKTIKLLKTVDCNYCVNKIFEISPNKKKSYKIPIFSKRCYETCPHIVFMNKFIRKKKGSYVSVTRLKNQYHTFFDMIGISVSRKDIDDLLFWNDIKKSRKWVDDQDRPDRLNGKYKVVYYDITLLPIESNSYKDFYR